MGFRISGLSAEPFRHLFGQSGAVLARHRARRVIATSPIGFPDRIALRDAAPGESLLLLNYTHQPADTPYRASHAIFVHEAAGQVYDACNIIPAVLAIRPISLRGFDAQHAMAAADLVDGQDLAAAIARQFENPEIAYLHAHFAIRGCYAALITRA